MSLPPLFDSLPAVFRTAFDAAAPWHLLVEPLAEALAGLPSDAVEIPLSPEVHLAGDRIAIGAGTRIQPGVLIEGPVRIGRNVLIRTGAYIRGGCWLGDGCVVGANTEVKHSILLDGAKAPHLAYVGDSVLGRGVNLGAGTVLSNFRHDGAEITIPSGGSRLATGRRKLGAILGDGVKTGCNAVLSPGVVIGAGTEIYSGVQLRGGVYPERSIVKLRQKIEVVARRDDAG